MFSNAWIGILAGLGAGAWIYSKMQRSTGGNTTNSLVVAGGSALIIFLLVTLLLGMFSPS